MQNLKLALGVILLVAATTNPYLPDVWTTQRRVDGVIEHHNPRTYEKVVEVERYVDRMTEERLQRERDSFVRELEREIDIERGEWHEERE